MSNDMDTSLFARVKHRPFGKEEQIRSELTRRGRDRESLIDKRKNMLDDKETMLANIV